MKTKAELRSEWKRKLAATDLSIRNQWSRQLSLNLLDHLRSLNVNPSKTIIGAFAPFQQEPDWTVGWDKSLKLTAFPSIAEDKMIFRLATLDELEHKEDFGSKILGPLHLHPIVEPDLFLVPGLVFDSKGGRLGRGKGYYDQALEHRRNSLKIGLAFEMQIIDEVPCDDHDVKLDFIVTEERIINCN